METTPGWLLPGRKIFHQKQKSHVGAHCLMSSPAGFKAACSEKTDWVAQEQKANLLGAGRHWLEGTVQGCRGAFTVKEQGVQQAQDYRTRTQQPRIGSHELTADPAEVTVTEERQGYESHLQ